MSKIIDGEKLAEKINNKTVQAVVELGKRPNLAIILVGDNPESVFYVNQKEKKAKEVGVDTHCYKCEADTGQEKIIAMIDYLNNDDLIDAIIVQLPLPKGEGYDTDKIIARIKPEKDVDRFHPENIKRLISGRGENLIMPPVFGAILTILNSIKRDLKNKKVAILANSDIFSKNLVKVLENRGVQAITCRANDPQLKTKTNQADILISALGHPNFIKKEMVKESAIVVDVGITRENGSVLGDVDIEDVKDKASYITPVPGGVGPMVVAMTLWNTVELYKCRRLDKHNNII